MGIRGPRIDPLARRAPIATLGPMVSPRDATVAPEPDAIGRRMASAGGWGGAISTAVKTPRPPLARPSVAVGPRARLDRGPAVALGRPTTVGAWTTTVVATVTPPTTTFICFPVPDPVEAAAPQGSQPIGGNTYEQARTSGCHSAEDGIERRIDERNARTYGATVLSDRAAKDGRGPDGRGALS